MNRIIRLLIISDVFLLTGFGLVQPILAIFVAEHVRGGSIIAAGIATTIFLLCKSIVQLPFSRYVDSHRNTIRYLHLGNILFSIAPILYLIDGSIGMIYIAQVIYGVGAGLAFPTWMHIWYAHLDDHHEGFDASAYSTATSIGAAAAAAIGAVIAQLFGFQATFVAVSVLSLIGSVLLFPLAKEETEIQHAASSTRKKRRGVHAKSRL